jgi:hypothetical protein
MIDTLNACLRTLTALVMRPFAVASPWPGLIAMSALIALVALLAFKFCSNQVALKRQKNRLFARLLEFQLFRDDLVGIFGAFGRVVVTTGLYLKESLKPLVVLFVPLVLILVHLAGWFEHRPLGRGEEMLVSVKLADERDPAQAGVSLAASPSLQIRTEPFISRAEHEVVWRVALAADAGEAWVEATVDGRSQRKTIATGGRLVPVSARRVRDGFWTRILNPGEPALPADAAIASIDVRQPRREILLGNTSVHWVVAIFVLSLAFGLVLKYPFGVDF